MILTFPIYHNPLFVDLVSSVVTALSILFQKMLRELQRIVRNWARRVPVMERVRELQRNVRDWARARRVEEVEMRNMNHEE